MSRWIRPLNTPIAIWSVNRPDIGEETSALSPRDKQYRAQPHSFSLSTLDTPYISDTDPHRPTNQLKPLLNGIVSTAAKHGKHSFDTLIMLAEGRPWLPAIQMT